jgi:hypothetical protein
MLGLQPKQTGQAGMDGANLVPLLQGDNAGADKLAKRALYWHWPHYSNHGAQSPGGAVLYQDYKLIEYYENNRVQLFNLGTDPSERNDLAGTQPEKVQELRTMLYAWRKDVNAEMPSPNPNFDPTQKWPAGESKDER